MYKKKFPKTQFNPPFLWFFSPSNTSTNPQTNKGMLPPHMIRKRKTYIFCFHPMQRCDLGLLKQLRCCFSCVGKESFVSFILEDPNTTKPNQMMERPTWSITTEDCNLLRVHRKHTNPSLNLLPKISKDRTMDYQMSNSFILATSYNTQLGVTSNYTSTNQSIAEKTPHTNKEF